MSDKTICSRPLISKLCRLQFVREDSVRSSKIPQKEVCLCKSFGSEAIKALVVLLATGFS